MIQRVLRLVFAFFQKKSVPYNPSIYDLSKPRSYTITLADGSLMQVSDEDFGYSPYIVHPKPALTLKGFSHTEGHISSVSHSEGISHEFFNSVARSYSNDFHSASFEDCYTYLES